VKTWRRRRRVVAGDRAGHHRLMERRAWTVASLTGLEKVIWKADVGATMPPLTTVAVIWPSQGAGGEPGGHERAQLHARLVHGRARDADDVAGEGAQ